MPRYIDAEKAVTRIREERKEWYRGDTFWGLSVAEIVIGEMPTEDVAPVVHARWEATEHDDFACSNCNTFFSGLDYYDDLLSDELKYCPHCGARMDG